MRVNARGDQLGPGGKIVRTREEVMSDHYAVRNLLYPEDTAQSEIPKLKQYNSPYKILYNRLYNNLFKKLHHSIPWRLKISMMIPSGPLDEPAQEDEWVEDENGDFVRPEDLKASTKGIADALAPKKKLVFREKTPKAKSKRKNRYKENPICK